MGRNFGVYPIINTGYTWRNQETIDKNRSLSDFYYAKVGAGLQYRPKIGTLNTEITYGRGLHTNEYTGLASYNAAFGKSPVGFEVYGGAQYVTGEKNEFYFEYGDGKPPINEQWRSNLLEVKGGAMLNYKPCKNIELKAGAQGTYDRSTTFDETNINFTQPLTGDTFNYTVGGPKTQFKVDPVAGLKVTTNNKQLELGGEVTFDGFKGVKQVDAKVVWRPWKK